MSDRKEKEYNIRPRLIIFFSGLSVLVLLFILGLNRIITAIDNALWSVVVVFLMIACGLMIDSREKRQK